MKLLERHKIFLGETLLKACRNSSSIPVLVRFDYIGSNEHNSYNWNSRNSDSYIYQERYCFSSGDELKGVAHEISQELQSSCIGIIEEINFIPAEENFHNQEPQGKTFEAYIRPFDDASSNDWNIVLKDYLEKEKRHIPLANSIMANTLCWAPLRIKPLSDAIRGFRQEDITNILLAFDYIAFSLSRNKIKIISEVLRTFGLKSQSFFPAVFSESNDIYKTPFQIIDEIESSYDSGESSFDSASGFLRVFHWFNHPDEPVDVQLMRAVFPFASEDLKDKIIRRYFHDIRRNVFPYDENQLAAFFSGDYGYYSNLRYLLQNWPRPMEVSSEFMYDCLVTYRATEKQMFQATNGILDLSIQKLTKSGVPLKPNFNKWLLSCDGGVIREMEFRGFVDFFIEYALDDMQFEGESLTTNVRTILHGFCTQCSHTEERPLIDSKTGLQALDSNTGEPVFFNEIVYENKWMINDNSSSSTYHGPSPRDYVSLFVDWDKGKGIDGLRPSEFTPEMMLVGLEECGTDSTDDQPDVVRKNVLEFCRHFYETESPEFNVRCPGKITMFFYESKMRALINEDVQEGEYSGADFNTIKEQVLSHFREVYGESLIRDYDPQILETVKFGTCFSMGGKNECFEKHTKRKGRWPVFCAPQISEQEHWLTSRRFAVCQGDTCFQTCIRKDTEWDGIKLIHILDIIGYNTIQETDAGFIPGTDYIRFTWHINKAIRFLEKLRCRSCGHILFPIKKGNNRLNQYNWFKCMMPTCGESGKEIYLNYCFQCKKGLIDSRDTKECPNGFRICPSCGSCCSDNMFMRIRQRYENTGGKAPASILRLQGLGHAERGMMFCYKCGAQMERKGDKWECPSCDSLPEQPLLDEDMGNAAPPPEYYESY